MKANAILAISCAFLIILSAKGYAGHGVGNGGDYIRASFMSMGWAAIQYLDETEEGAALKQLHQLDSADLLRTLDINVIEVQDRILIDNNGSVVDALGSKDKIILSKDNWADHFENGRDVYFLVFHEMLRALEINDDNYTISKSIAPFPNSRKIVTRLAAIFPIIGQTPLDQILGIDQILVEGSGCSSKVDGSLTDIDLERNILTLSPRRFDISLRDNLAGQKSCTIVVPYKAPSGKRLVVSQLDFSAKVLMTDSARASIATDAVFGGTSMGAKSKSYVSSGTTQGRLFLRTNTAVASRCDGTSGLLKIRAVGSLQKPVDATGHLNQLIGDAVAVSFVVEDCARF